MKSKCLEEAEIAAYVDGGAGAAERERVESHIALCPLCLHSVAELKQLVDAHESAPVRTPAAALARATRIIDAGREQAPELSIIAALQ